jgi:hypothetical protein
MPYTTTPVLLYLVKLTKAQWVITAGVDKPLSGEMIFTSDFEALEWATAYVSTWTDRINLIPVDSTYKSIRLEIDQR